MLARAGIPACTSGRRRVPALRDGRAPDLPRLRRCGSGAGELLPELRRAARRGRHASGFSPAPLRRRLSHGGFRPRVLAPGRRPRRRDDQQADRRDPPACLRRGGVRPFLWRRRARSLEHGRTRRGQEQGTGARVDDRNDELGARVVERDQGRPPPEARAEGAPPRARGASGAPRRGRVPGRSACRLVPEGADVGDRRGDGPGRARAVGGQSLGRGGRPRRSGRRSAAPRSSHRARSTGTRARARSPGVVCRGGCSQRGHPPRTAL